MKKIVLWLMSTVTVLVLLFGYHTSTSSANARGGNSSLAAPVQGSVSGSGGSAAPGSAAPASSAPSSSAASSSAAAAGPSGTYTGSVAQTRWGPVEVQITVANGKITKVAVPVYPDGSRRDQEINAVALPILVRETLHAQNAKIDMVSGGTVTSDGYVRSLQSALDKAGL